MDAADVITNSLFCGRIYVMLNVADISPLVKEELMCCHVLVYMQLVQIFCHFNKVMFNEL